MVKIGLEIHAYLNTKEKLFCDCKAEHGIKHAKPNTNICPICTGQPGSKPMLPNLEAINRVIQIALILGCKINSKLVWQRKHYSWPDLPKGYQNTMSGPYATENGTKGKFQGIRITEVHLEEDPAAWNPETGQIDYNRSGSPLIEIVTDPDFKNAKEVIEWMKQLITTLNYIKAIDKKAGVKADVNVSINGGKRVEMKNITGLQNISKALEYEINRQKKEGVKEQHTRMFDADKNVTKMMRSKEQAADYRFISDPDLPVINIEKKRIEKIEKETPETPEIKLKKLVKKYKIDSRYAKILTKKLDIVELFEDVVQEVHPKLAINWVVEELLSMLNYNKKELDEIDLDSQHFIDLLKLVEKKELTESKAQEILRSWKEKSESPKGLIKKQGKISDLKELGKLADKVIKENKKAVEDYKSGKRWSINFLIGQIMKLTNKRADFKIAKEVLEKKLG